MLLADVTVTVKSVSISIIYYLIHHTVAHSQKRENNIDQSKNQTTTLNTTYCLKKIKLLLEN